MDEVLAELNRTQKFEDVAFSIMYGEITEKELDILADLCVTVASYKAWDMSHDDMHKVYWKAITHNISDNGQPA